jgi:uncharacterized protein (DUF1697 family)
MSSNSRYIAFLGGINVGGHRVKMDRLCGLFSELGFSNVRSFIASGNVLFESSKTTSTPSLETAIEESLREALGYEVPTFLRTPAQLVSVVDSVPFKKKELEMPNYTLHIGFFRRVFSVEDAAVVQAFQTPMDAFRVADREMYWLCRGKILETQVKWPALRRKLENPSTARNITMLRRLIGVVY